MTPPTPIEKSIAAKVTTAVVAVLTPVIGALAFWLQDKLGIDMDPAAAAAFVGSVVAGVALVGFRYLHGLDVWQRLTHFGADVLDAGEQVTTPVAKK